MRATWKRDGVFSLKIADRGYSLAQMLRLPFVRFYAILRSTDEWNGVDLNHERPLFCVSVGKVVLQRLGHRMVPNAEVTPSHAPFERYFIRPHVNYNGPPLFLGGDLVDLGADGEEGSSKASIVTPNLDPNRHREIIMSHELTGVHGDNHIIDRLVPFFDTGIDHDRAKEQVFPSLA